MRIDRNAWYSHSASHDRDFLSFVLASVPEHISNRVDLFDIREVVFGDVFCTEGIAWHQANFCEGGFGCVDVRCWYSHFKMGKKKLNKLGYDFFFFFCLIIVFN